MLCLTFTAADFSCCLFVGLSAFSFVFSKWNACSIRLKSGDWLGHCKILFFTFKNSWVAFAVCFGSLSICTMKHRPINFAPFGWIWADSISLYTSEFFRLLLSSFTSSINTSNPVPLEAMHAHAITLLHHVSQMMNVNSWMYQYICMYVEIVYINCVECVWGDKTGNNDTIHFHTKWKCLNSFFYFI